MNIRRVFTTFLIATVIVISFVYLVIYNIFIKETNNNSINVYHDYLKSKLNNLYTASKYDLTNFLKDRDYRPVSRILSYNKESRLISPRSDKRLSDGELDYLKENIDNITYLKDGFGYIPPYIHKDSISIFTMLESGDEIVISSLNETIPQKDLQLCTEVEKGREFRSISVCQTRDTKEILNLQSFSIKYSIKNPGLLKSIILAYIITLLISSLMAFWVSTHFDLEEKRLITEITEGIEGIERGEKPLITITSNYKHYNNLIKEMNRLISKLSSELDRYKVVYEQYFKDKERERSINEGMATIYSFLKDTPSSMRYEQLFKALDILFKQNGGGIRFSGEIKKNEAIKPLILILLEILSTSKPYNLIIEGKEEEIQIISENISFSPDSLTLQDYYKLLTIEPKRIILITKD